LTGKCALFARSLLLFARSLLLKKGTLVKNPKTESYQKLLNAVEEQANLQDGVYVDINGYLKEMNSETFIENKPVWHRSCYSDATNAISIQRARDRLEHAISTGMYTTKNVDIKEHDLKWMKLT